MGQPAQRVAGPAALPQRLHATDINEFDLIYGGEKWLFRAIREVIEKTDPPAVFVYRTCVTAMIGDDIEALCKRASEKFGKPVIPINVPGFAGPKNLGNKFGAEALLDDVIGTVKPEFTTPCDINIVRDDNLSGELWQVKPLFDALCVRVLACISGDVRLLLLAHADPAAGPFAECAAVADTVALACLGDNHLWQDRQLASRAELSALVAKHSADMKWMKFLYKQLCEREQILICKSPSCAVSCDRAL